MSSMSKTCMISFEYMYLSDNSMRLSQKSVIMCGTCITNGNTEMEQLCLV